MPVALAAGTAASMQFCMNSQLRGDAGVAGGPVAATTVAPILTGRVLASIAIVGFGLFRVAAQEATPLRLLGATLIVAGLFFVQRF